jgi:hypothetical protein
MLFGSLHCRRRRSGASRPRDTFRIGSRVGRSSNLVMRLLAPVLIVIVVLGLAVRPYAVACASSSCDRMVNCGQCDAVPGACPQGLACVKRHSAGTHRPNCRPLLGQSRVGTGIFPSGGHRGAARTTAADRRLRKPFSPALLGEGGKVQYHSLEQMICG